jgi:integrase
MATIDQRGAFWRARVRIPGFKLKTRSFNTEAQARAWASRKEAELRAGKDTIPDSHLEMTLGEALERYLKEITPEKKGRVQEERRIRAWLRRTAIVEVKLSQLKPTHFTEFKKDRLQEGTAANTVRLDLALISNLYTIARKEWNLAYLQNPIADMRMPKRGKPRNRLLSPEERARLSHSLSECRNPLVPLVVEFALESAARQGEILHLLQSDLDLHKRVALFRDTKNGTDRAVPLSQRTVEILTPLARRAGGRVFPITRNGLVAAFRRAVRRARIENFRFHDLRHCGTTSLFERGLEVMEVQKITGHKTLKILLDYTHLNPSHIVDRLDETEARASRVAAERLAPGADASQVTQPGARGAPPTADPIVPNAGKDGASKTTQPPSNVIVFPRRR